MNEVKKTNGTEYGLVDRKQHTHNISIMSFRNSISADKKLMPKKKKPKTTTQSNGCILVETAVDKKRVLPLHFCVYRSQLKQYVYLPAGYGKRYQNWNPQSNPPFCKMCRLQPCMNVEYAKEIYGYGHSLVMRLGADLDENQLGHINTKICNMLFDVVRKHMKDLFGNEYTERWGIPRCVWEKVLQTFPGDGEYWYNTTDGEDSIDSPSKGSPNNLVSPDFLQDVHVGKGSTTKK